MPALLFASQLLLICTLLSKSMGMYILVLSQLLDFTIYCQICQIPIVSKSSFAQLQAYSHFFIYTESSLVEQSTPRSHLIFDAQVQMVQGLGDGMGWLRNPWDFHRWLTKCPEEIWAFESSNKSCMVFSATNGCL